MVLSSNWVYIQIENLFLDLTKTAFDKTVKNDSDSFSYCQSLEYPQYEEEGWTVS